MTNITYFDNAATTFPKPEEVYRFMDSFYRECGVNVGRGQHRLASKGAYIVAETRKLLTDLTHCPNKQVIFTPTATEALNLIIRSYVCRNNINVYVSPFEHNAVTRVINYARQSYDFNVITLAFDIKSSSYDLDQISCQFELNKPDVLIVSHASNVCGVIAPISEICIKAKEYGSVNIIDMCQTMGLIDTDLSSECIDFAVFAGHKTLYGPQGLGGLLMSPGATLKPLIYGGTGVDSANPLLPDEIPERYEVGSQNILAIAGLNASLKWILGTGVSTLFDKEQRSHRELINLFSQYNNIRLVSPRDISLGIGVVSVVFDGYSSDNIAQILSDHNIAVRSGLHCAPVAHQVLGTFPAGTVRFSIGYFTDESDFTKLKKVLDYISENS